MLLFLRAPGAEQSAEGEATVWRLEAMLMEMINRGGPECVALETTLLTHGVPRGEGAALARELASVVSREGARPAVVGVYRGRGVVGLNESELGELLDAADLPKANTSNLGALLHRGASAATTVSTTMELAAAAGVRVFATGGIGGVHQGYGARLDVSADLLALCRFPVAVVSSGVKAILDVESTREALEMLGVPVVGFGTDIFPAFYLRESDAGVDVRFDDAAELASFVKAELARTGRGVLVCNPISTGQELDPDAWGEWLAEAQLRAAASGARGREVTPRVLGLLHEVSGGATLRANIALVRANAELAGRLCAGMVV